VVELTVQLENMQPYQEDNQIALLAPALSSVEVYQIALLELVQ
jgi:hypothetical protein